MHRARTPAFVAVASLVMVACGSLVEPLPQQPQGLGPGASPLPGATGVPTVGPSVGPTTPGVIPTTTALPNPFQTPTPGVEPCVASSAPGNGVTKDTIKLGLIASLTGPLPGQFDSAVQAVDSYFKALNESGGICGRRVQLVIRDDNGDGNTNLRLAEQLVKEEKIFAFVGSHSAPDDSGIAKVSKRDKIPDIGFPLTWERTENPYTYGSPGQVQKATIGTGASGSKWLNKKFKIEQIAIFWLRESEVSILNAWAFEAAMQKVTKGKLEICHEQPSGVLDNNYTNYVVSMKGKCDPERTAVYSTMENNANIKLATAMRDQNFKPKVFAPTFSSYLQSFITDAQGATEGAYIAMPQIPFERLSRPTSEWTPGTYELNNYLTALKRHYPNHVAPGSFGAPAWGSAVLFTDAARACGDKLTRSCLFREIDAMDSFTANGLLTPTTPRNHHIYTADLFVKVENGRFVEVPHEGTGPPEAPDFWDQSTLFNWQKYYCANKHLFPNTDEKDQLIDEC